MSLLKATCLLFVTTLVLLALIDPASSECCYGYECGKRYLANILCLDCEKSDKYFCGKRDGGGCNMFGCNCGGGCIEEPEEGLCDDIKECIGETDRKARDLANVERTFARMTSLRNGSDVVQFADMDGDGLLDGLEVRVFLTGLGHPLEDWRALDSNQDDKLDATEIDN